MSGVTDDPAEPLRLELYVRSLSPRLPRRDLATIVERLADLCDADVVAEYDVFVTGRELPATPADASTDYGRFLVNRLAVFHRWASATGRALTPALERRTVHSRITGDDHDAVVPPTAMLAEYDADDLRFVSPCREGDERVSVHDRLDALAAEEVTAVDDRLRDARPTRPPEPGSPG